MVSKPNSSEQNHTSGNLAPCNVVITGVGVVSPIGIGSEAFWQSLRDQQSGVDILPANADIDRPVRIGGAIKQFEPKQYVKPRKALKVMCREIQTGFSAAGLAVEQAALDRNQIESDRIGVIFGSEMLYAEPAEMKDVYDRCIENGEFRMKRWGEAAMAKMYPLWMLMYLPNMIACHVGIANDAHGPNNTICQGDVSSSLAMIEAANIIRRGRADVMITGGSSSRLSMTAMLYRGIDHLSSQIDSPETACRPFDATRDGTVNGEGAAAFLLENEEYARARGAKILARLRGWGMSFGNRQHDEPTHEQAIRRSIEHALAHAGIEPPEIGHVNAHAGGLVGADSIEASAIQHVLGDAPVTAPKSFFGDIGAGGGAVEMVASVMALQHNEIPVTLNYSEPDRDCPVRVVHGTAASPEHPTALVMSQSNTGQAVTVVLDRET